MAELFGVDVSTINEHLKNIYKSHELEEKATIGKFPIAQKKKMQLVLFWKQLNKRLVRRIKH